VRALAACLPPLFNLDSSIFDLPSDDDRALFDLESSSFDP